jgi:hypothetical protein
MTKATTQTIRTNLYSTPTIHVPANFTALHLAHISWNLYSLNAPTSYSNEFSIDDSSDFAHYCIQDSMDIAQHFYECAFAIGRSVCKNVDYSIQNAFDCIDDFYGDTSVREDVSTQLVNNILAHIKCAEYDNYTYNIALDYSALVEETATQLPEQIAQLEKQLASLKAQA